LSKRNTAHVEELEPGSFADFGELEELTFEEGSRAALAWRA
jgi:hypothetical protein